MIAYTGPLDPRSCDKYIYIHIWLELRRLPPNSPILNINTGPGPGLETLFCESWLAGISLPACAALCWLRQHASWRRLALRARRRWRGRCAPGACSEPDLRLALRAGGARRTALRAEGAARLCAGRHSRWLPSTARATRSAPMAWALRAGALRARAPAAARSRPRAARSAPMAWALRARAPACVPPR